MDIDRVRYFHCFAETGSLVRASEILHISQPALSKALKILEREVGQQLLEPDGRGLRVTEAGRRFHAESAPLLNGWLDLPRRLKQQTGATPTRLGSFEVFTTYFLGHLVNEIALENLEIYELGPGRLEQAVKEGRADFGITYLPVPTAGVDFTEVTRIRMGVFGQKEPYDAFSFGDLPFVVPLLPVDGTPSKVAGLDGWPDHRFARALRYRVTMMESALALCRQGAAVGYFPEFVVRLHNNDVLATKRLTELKCPLSLKDRLQSVYLVNRRGTEESTLFRQIAKLLRALK